MGKRFYLLVAMLVGLGWMSITGCQPNRKAIDGKLKIMVSIAPQKSFVERIGNGYVDVDVMVPAGAEPHTYEPRPEQLKALSQAHLYLRIQSDFEAAWMDKFRAINPKMRVVDTAAGIQRLPMRSLQSEKPTASTPGETLDPHIWLSPALVKIQAQTIYHAIVAMTPQYEATYRFNLNRFVADIDALDQEIRKSLQGIKSRKFIVFHPAWGYFARDYGLEMIPIEVEGQEPSAAELAQLIATAKRNHIKVIFAEPQFSQRTATTIAQQIGGEVVLLDPMAPDWFSNLRQVSTVLSRTLSQLGTGAVAEWMEQPRPLAPRSTFLRYRKPELNSEI